MRPLLLLTSILFASPAWADAADDYAACLIGRAAVEIHHGAGASEAQERAYKLCPEPKLDENEAEGLSDYVNLIIEDIAGK